MLGRPGIARLPAVILAVLLAGCGGGGGGGGGGGAAPAPAPPASPAASFLTPEFNAQYGLGRINAQSAYARGATGAGVTVAVVDTGIDVDHPDLAANIAPASIDILTGSAATLNDVDGHGTAVAGVIGALKNDVGMHGVAFNARLLAVRADAALCPSVACGFTDSDVAAAINYAVAQGARVINLSLGGPAPSAAVLQTALANAAAAGVILVIAAGNDAGADPLSPASLAIDPTLRGAAIAVGAVDRDNAIAAASNRAGSAQAAYVVAPGVGILTTGNMGGYVLATGTSFSAPHVAGAAALLLQLFPNLTAQQIVRLLLDTATDLGAPGDDPVYGQGLINLALAAQPQGVSIVPLPGGASVSLAATGLSLGPAFGDALTAEPLLADAMTLDALGRAFKTDLRQRLSIAGRGFQLEALVAGDRWRSLDLSPAEGINLSVAARDDVGETLREVLPFGQVEESRRFESLSFAADLDGGRRLTLGYNLSPGQAAPRPAVETAFWDAEAMLQPGASLLGRGEGAGFVQAFGESTRLFFAAFRGREDEESARALGAGSLTQAGLQHDLGPATLRLTVAAVEEDEAFLGGEGTGAFAHGDGATSRFVTLGGSWRLGGGAELFGSATTAASEMPEGRGLLTDWGTVRSDAFGLGIAFRDLLGAGDRLGFLVGQPLRVRDATATLTAPVALTTDGAIALRSERVDAAPSGREIDLQASYSHEPAAGVRLSYFLMMQREPGHDADAEPAYGAGLTLKVGF